MDKVNIGILSLNINTPDFNYGALLHSWAFQKFLEKELDANIEVIDYVTPCLESIDRKRPILSSLKNGKIKYAIKQLLNYPTYYSRLKKFNNFISKNMKISSKKYIQSTLNNEKNLKYDILICESDVIWSVGFFHGKFDKTFFLALDSMKNKKKIAYAPSMADGDLTSDQGVQLKKLLLNLDYISCRESYEKNILKKYTDKEIIHVVDPVLLLESNDYNCITSERLINEDYLLLYLPVNNNNKLRKSAKKYAKKNNLKILEINTNVFNISSKNFLFVAGIEDFLSAIKYANVIFTNSFHAICFSIIFNKEFYAFSRKSNGKVRDICKTMGLEERFLEDDEFKELQYIDYTKINKKWKNLQQQSKDWILNAIYNKK